MKPIFAILVTMLLPLLTQAQLTFITNNGAITITGYNTAAGLNVVIPASLVGNQVQIKWGWGGNSAYPDSCEIQVDRGDGKGFVFLAIDTIVPYTDTQPMPAAAVWKYKAIYLQADQCVGQWSDVVSIPVAV